MKKLATLAVSSLILALMSSPAMATPVWATGEAQSVAENTTLVTALNAGVGATFAITGGADAAKFEIFAGANFELKFKVAPDFETKASAAETPSNEYTVIVTATIGADTVDRTFTVTVTNVVAAWSAETEAVSINENTTAVPYLATATGEAPIVYSIKAGKDGALFGINTSSGALSFVAAPDFEDPQGVAKDNTYVVDVVATSDDASVATLTLTITVLDVDETSGTPPSSGGGGSTTVTTPVTTPAPTPGFFSGKKWTITVDDAGVSSLDINLAKSQAGKNVSFYKRTKQGKLILLDEEQRLGKNGKASITTDKLLRTGQKVRVQVDGKFRSTVTMP